MYIITQVIYFIARARYSFIKYKQSRALRQFNYCYPYKIIKPCKILHIPRQSSDFRILRRVYCIKILRRVCLGSGSSGECLGSGSSGECLGSGSSGENCTIKFTDSFTRIFVWFRWVEKIEIPLDDCGEFLRHIWWWRKSAPYDIKWMEWGCTPYTVYCYYFFTILYIIII